MESNFLASTTIRYHISLLMRVVSHQAFPFAVVDCIQCSNFHWLLRALEKRSVT